MSPNQVVAVVLNLLAEEGEEDEVNSNTDWSEGSTVGG